MLGAALGIAVWILGFLAVGLGFFALFGGAFGMLFDLVFTWTQVPVVALTYLTLLREGIPGGAGELKRALAWAGDDDAGDVSEAPFNSALVGLELGAVILVTVGLVLCTMFSISITTITFGAFGRPLTGPTRITIAGVQPGDAFATFVAGGVLWQVALFVEASEWT